MYAGNPSLSKSVCSQHRGEPQVLHRYGPLLDMQNFVINKATCKHNMQLETSNRSEKSEVMSNLLDAGPALK